MAGDVCMGFQVLPTDLLYALDPQRLSSLVRVPGKRYPPLTLTSNGVLVGDPREENTFKQIEP